MQIHIPPGACPDMGTGAVLQGGFPDHAKGLASQGIKKLCPMLAKTGGLGFHEVLLSGGR